MRSAENGPFPYGKAICYSGFRKGQQPGGAIPSSEEIKEDLLILSGEWKYLRLYDCDPHAELVLDIIKTENMDFQVMLGMHLDAEVNNYNCPWGGTYPEDVLNINRTENLKRINKLIDLAKQYPKIICSLSAGNEACVDWTDHYVPPERVVEYVKLIQKSTHQPVTFCENYVPWLDKLEPLAAVVDFISIHSYPVWEYKSIAEAIEYTKENYYAIANKYPHKSVIITEAGWTTKTNGQGINPENVSEEFQKIYIDRLMDWVSKEQILTFVFEAFDESWKGSEDPLEPEKHWGLFREDRTPKLIIQDALFI